MVHLDVEEWSEELLRQLTYAIKNQLLRAPIIGPFRAWKPPFPYAIKNQRRASKDPIRGLWMPEQVLYGIRELAEQFLGPLLDIEVDHSAVIALF